MEKDALEWTGEEVCRSDSRPYYELESSRHVLQNWRDLVRLACLGFLLVEWRRSSVLVILSRDSRGVRMSCQG